LNGVSIEAGVGVGEYHDHEAVAVKLMCRLKVVELG
jgi:hypothetical protein